MSTRNSQKPVVDPVADARSLVDDNRGAIMVVAVFMAAFLVGALWYIIGIGDAVVYRERMQDGADAVAYAAAVYHARGMNLIAMINIIMAGLLAVLIALKLVQVINTIAMAISCALAWTGFGAAVCGFTSDVVRPALKTAISAYEDFLKPTLRALSKAEKGIAYAMPWVAEAKAVTVSKSYDKPVNMGGIVSSSLIPYGEREGLPVQEDTYANLCGRAGHYVADVMMLPFGSYAGWVGGVIGGIAKSFPGYFCGSNGALGVNLKKAAVGQICEKSKQKFDKKHAGEKNPPSFNMDKCKSAGQQKKASKAVAKKLGKLKGLAGDMGQGDAMTPKKVFEEAKNGNGYFQVWSVVIGDDQWPKQDDKGVEIAAWGKKLGTPAIPWGKVGFAEAEFYFDTSGAWEKYKDDAMWHMWWRARFRRVRPPTPNVTSMLSEALGETLSDKLSGAVSGKLKNDSFLGYAIGTSAADKAGKEMKKVLVGGGAWVDDKIQDAVLKQYDKLQVIH